MEGKDSKSLEWEKSTIFNACVALWNEEVF